MSQASAQSATDIRSPGGSNYFAGSNWVLIVGLLVVGLVVWQLFRKKR